MQAYMRTISSKSSTCSTMASTRSGVGLSPPPVFPTVLIQCIFCEFFSLSLAYVIHLHAKTVFLFLFKEPSEYHLLLFLPLSIPVPF